MSTPHRPTCASLPAASPGEESTPTLASKSGTSWVELPIRGGVVLVDADDAHFVSAARWCVQISPSGVRYAIARYEGLSPARLHRVILGAKPGEEIDHLNINGLDNRRCNLRICTRSENVMNRRLQRNNTSGLKGASWNRWAGRWQSRCVSEGRTRYLGSFDTAEQAHAAYCAFASKAHGAFFRAA